MTLAPSPAESSTAPNRPLAPNGHLAPHRLAALTAALLLIDDARIYGLIDTDPAIDRTRCNRVLANLKRDGVVAEQDEISTAAVELMAELGTVRS